jgi:hypothetical protein
MQPSSGRPLRARSTEYLLSVLEVRMTVDSHQRPSLSCDFFSARRLASGLRDDERLPKG